MIKTAPATHVVYLHRDLARRMLIGADARAHYGKDPKTRKDAASFSRYLERSLRVRGGRIEIRGPKHWIENMVVVCGDVRAALEIGRQLQAE